MEQIHTNDVEGNDKSPNILNNTEDAVDYLIGDSLNITKIGEKVLEEFNKLHILILSYQHIIEKSNLSNWSDPLLIAGMNIINDVEYKLGNIFIIK